MTAKEYFSLHLSAMQILPDLILLLLNLLLSHCGKARLEHGYWLSFLFHAMCIFFCLIALPSLNFLSQLWLSHLFFFFLPIFCSTTVLFIYHRLVINIKFELFILIRELRDLESAITNTLLNGLFLDLLLLLCNIFKQLTNFCFEVVIIFLEINVQLPFRIAAQRVDPRLLNLIEEVVGIELFPNGFVKVQVEEEIFIVLLLLLLINATIVSTSCFLLFVFCLLTEAWTICMRWCWIGGQCFIVS